MESKGTHEGSSSELPGQSWVLALSLLTCSVWVLRKRRWVVLPSGRRMRRVEIFSVQSGAGSWGTTLAMLCLMA